MPFRDPHAEMLGRMEGNGRMANTGNIINHILTAKSGQMTAGSGQIWVKCEGVNEEKNGIFGFISLFIPIG